jgi:hypothetical protein
MIVGNGTNIMFWLDRWHSGCALAISFYHLFNICSNQYLIVFEVVMSKGQALKFTRQLTGMLLIEYQTIMKSHKNLNHYQSINKKIYS